MNFTEIIIGFISEEVADAVRMRGKKLRFMYWSKHGLPVHKVV